MVSVTNDENQIAKPDQGFVLSNTVVTRIAGYRFHASTPATPGETVQFVREPNNAWDSNAIAVYDGSACRIGYLYRQIAAEYAWLMDNGSVRLSGRLAAPGEPGYDPSRAEINPPLFVWVNVDQARLSEVLAQAG